MAFGGATFVAGGAGAVGKGVFSGVRNIVPGHHRQASRTSIAEDQSDNGYALQSAPQSGDTAEYTKAPGGINGGIASSPLVGGGNPDFGTLHITVGDLEGAPEKEKVYLALKYGSKTLDKSHTIKGSAGSHDVFNVKTLPEAMTLGLVLLEKRTLGKDRELGQGSLDVWKHISPGVTNATDTSVAVGAAQVQLHLAWTALANEAPGTPARVSTLSQARTSSPNSPASIKSKSRFSMHRKKHESDNREE